MSWPLHNQPQPWNTAAVMSGMAMHDMNGSYTPEQWALMQQQNWQQWTQWQQQYSQWQNQYGDKYAQQLQAVGVGGIPPPPPSGAIPPPPPDKPPPPPPHENNQPLFNSKKDTPAPALNPPSQRNNSNYNSNSETGNNQWSYSADVQQQPAVNAEALKKLAEEERLFDIQFQKWEEEIDKWRQENVNHPDKQAYKDYEAKFEACRKQLLERRQQMKAKRASLLNNPPPPNSTGNTSVAPPTSKTSNQNNYSQNPQSQKNPQNNTYERQYDSPQSSNKRNNKNVEPQDRFESYHQNTGDSYASQGNHALKSNKPSESSNYGSHGGHPPQSNKIEHSTFLPTSASGKGIPGLDLVPDTLTNKAHDVIDLSDDQSERQGNAPDYSTISMGINNILGDEKIMNILSMVRGFKPNQETEIGNAAVGPFNNENQQIPSNNQGNRNQNFQPQHNRQNNMPNNMPNNRQGNYSQLNQEINTQFPPPNHDGNYNRPNAIPQDHYFNQNNQFGGPRGSNNMRGGPSGPGMIGGPGIRQGGPGIRPGGSGMHQGGPGVHPGGPGMHQSGPGMNQGGSGMRPSGPGMQPGGMRPSGPNMQQTGQNMQQTGQNMQQTGLNMQHGGLNMQQGGPNMQQGGQNMQQTGLNMQHVGLDMQQGGPNMQQGGPNMQQGGSNMQQPQPLMASRVQMPVLPNNAQGRPPLQDVSSQQNADYYGGAQTQPPKQKWIEDPLFTPSIIVEYEHKSLRLKARDFIEPVHTFDYNHISKDSEFKKKDFEYEADDLFTRKPRRFERDYPEERFRDQGSRDLFERDYERRGNRGDFRDLPRDIREIRGESRDIREPRDTREPRDIHRDIRGEQRDIGEPRVFRDIREAREFRDSGGRDDFHPRDRPRDVPRDDFDRRRDERHDERRREDRDRHGNRRVVNEDQRDRDFNRDRRRDENRDVRRDENRDVRRDDSKDIRRDDSRDSRRDDNRDTKRDDYRNRSTSRDKDSRKRGLSRDSEVSSNGKKSKDTSQSQHVVMIDDLLEPPGRSMRPEKIVIILRGLPGSGKSYLAKLIRDREAELERGGTARIMSIDDYFMQEGEIEETDPTTGKIIKKPSLKYEYDESLEESYTASLKRAFKRSLTDGYFSFLIYDAINSSLQSYADIWNYARQNGFQVYICTMENDVQTCFKRNIHNRKLEDIEVLAARFFPTPAHHIQLDATTLLQSAAITDVHMEDADDVVMDDTPKEEVESVFTSKWEKMDDADKLARLDGTSKPLRPSQFSMEDYLQLDDWTPNTAKPGKKSVRWADIEESRKQEKMRAIGFVVGQTDWNRMTDPTMGSSALTQTKYIERVKRN